MIRKDGGCEVRRREQERGKIRGCGVRKGMWHDAGGAQERGKGKMCEIRRRRRQEGGL